MSSSSSSSNPPTQSQSQSANQPQNESQSHLTSPSSWTTGTDPPTTKQLSFLSTLATSQNRPDIDPSGVSTKSDASKLIDELKSSNPSSTNASGSSSSGANANAASNNTTASASSVSASASDASAPAPGEEEGGDGAGQGEGGNGGQGNVGGTIQDPKTWTTGSEPATGKQMGYIAVMAREAGEEGPVGQGGMGKSEASMKIEELKSKTGM